MGGRSRGFRNHGGFAGRLSTVERGVRGHLVDAHGFQLREVTSGDVKSVSADFEMFRWREVWFARESGDISRTGSPPCAACAIRAIIAARELGACDDMCDMLRGE